MELQTKVFVDNLKSIIAGLGCGRALHAACRDAGDHDDRSLGAALDAHYHQSWELKIITRGALRCRFVGRAMDIKPYSALLIAPRQIHYSTVPADLRGNTVWLNCLFENGDIRLMLMQGRQVRHYFFSSDQKSELTVLLGCSADEFCGHIARVLERPGISSAQALADKWLFIFFASLQEAILHPSISSPQSDLVSRAIALLNNMYGDANLTVRGMAKMLNVSPKYLSTIFRRMTGVTLRQKLIRIRLENAFRLMQAGKFSVKETAAFTGWQNQFYFSNSFRRHYGLSPSEVAPLKQGN